MASDVQHSFPLPYKMLLSFLGILLAVSVSTRLVYAVFYTVGNIIILEAYHKPNDIDRNNILSRAKYPLSQMSSYSSLNQAPMWHLSYVSLLLGDYDDAASQMQVARLNERTNFLLTPEIADYHILEAILSSRDGEWEEAVDSYRIAIALEPAEWQEPLYQRYYESIGYSGQVTNEAVASLVLDVLSSSDAVLEPMSFRDGMTDWLSISDNGHNAWCWTLTHIQYNPTALEIGSLIPVNLMWIDAENEESLYESKLVANLVPNGGFEWGVAATGQPIGYPRTIYDEDNLLEVHQLRMMETAQAESSTVAVLENSSSFYNSSFVTRPIQVDTKKLYIQGGWLRNDNGNGSLGLGWYGRLPDVENPYHFLQSTTAAIDWLFYSEAVSLPKGINSIDLVLTNYNSVGSVYFDNLFFFEITPPAC